ncbi:HNH endonuclease [Rhizobium helianthi]|uniref:HNH endonuclease n=1 Tax=Rhizobium helianthi TaxID=1132695 RepID=A0ABW4M7R3_9HYPH
MTGTAHWMFDHGLLPVDEDHSLLIAGGGVPDTITRLMNPERGLLVPSRPDERPHSQFLRYHQETVFKG